MGDELVLPSTQKGRARTGDVTQATAVEQARAVAEVQAEIVVAQQCRRDPARSIVQMEEECSQPDLANRAFYRFPRAGQTVAGASVHLARTLARCWGNIQYGITELRRDDQQRVSEMMAWAWDVETNVRASNTFVVPHKRDKRGGPVDIVDLRDVYENNANQGSRRLREAIFAVLPTWFTAQAEARCQATIEDGGGKPLPQRIADAIKVFDSFGVDVARLETHVGRPSKDWTANDIAGLQINHSSLRQGTATVDEVFPPVEQPVTAGEIEGAVK